MKLSPGQVEEIVELRERGWSYQRIAMKFGVSDGAIHYHCLKHGAISPRSRAPVPFGTVPTQNLCSNGRTQRRFSPDEDERLQQLSIEGNSIARISEITGRAPTSVRMRLMALAIHEELAA